MRNGNGYGQEHFDRQLVEDSKDTTLANYYSSCVRDLDASVTEFIEAELISEKGFRNFYPLEDAMPSRLTEEELAHRLTHACSGSWITMARNGSNSLTTFSPAQSSNIANGVAQKRPNGARKRSKMPPHSVRRSLIGSGRPGGG